MLNNIFNPLSQTTEVKAIFALLSINQGLISSPGMLQKSYSLKKTERVESFIYLIKANWGENNMWVFKVKQAWNHSINKPCKNIILIDILQTKILFENSSYITIVKLSNSFWKLNTSRNTIQTCIWKWYMKDTLSLSTRRRVNFLKGYKSAHNFNLLYICKF